MEHHLFILLFFTGAFPLALSVTRNYHLVKQKRNWTAAQTYCQATYTDLAIIKSNDDMVQLQNEAQSKQFNSSAWIGLYNNNSWRWSFKNEPLGDMRKWEADEPNNRGGNQECGVINAVGWNDLLCTEMHHIMCFDETKTGNDRYIYIYNKTQWHEAQAYCRQYHTDLATVTDEEENSVVMGLNSGTTWLGLFKDPWKWVDHTNFSTISWLYGQPDNGKWNETCGYLYMGQAADARCSDIRPFFCYTVIRKKRQIVRMKIQSNQDLNDPAINAAILEKLKQKLKNHGLGEDIMVKWRGKLD